MEHANTLWSRLNHYFTEVQLFKIQDVGITLSHLMVALFSVLMAYLISFFVRAALRRRVFPRMRVDQGLEYSMLRVTHYVILIIGTYMGLKTINLPLGALVGLFAVLGVGIGFGLQNLASNFVSGVILLLERPVKVGDRITVDNVWGDVQRITLRTTQLRTPDNVTVIIPNSKLLENNVVNDSFGDPKVRLRVPVGVAYGSDIDAVTEALLDAARAQDAVLDTPEPVVWFCEFADSSLNFELLVWIPDPARKFWIRDKLNREIDRRFREAGIVIPFPQRDVHLYTAEKSSDGALVRSS